MSVIYALDRALREKFLNLDEKSSRPFAAEEDRAKVDCTRMVELFRRSPVLATHFYNDTGCVNGLLDARAGVFEVDPKYPDCKSCPVGQGDIGHLATRLERAIIQSYK